MMRGLFCSIMILFALLDVVTIKCNASPIEIQGGKDISITYFGVLNISAVLLLSIFENIFLPTLSYLEVNLF